MKRVATFPRLDWQKKVEAQGLAIHTLDGKPYWNESVYYQFSNAEINQLESAIRELYRLCVEATGFVIEHGLWDLFSIPTEFGDWIRQSWDSDHPSLYGRFDLAWDGTGAPKLIEFNADTPTSLVEAAVIQWFWLEDRIRDGQANKSWDQFNNIHEMLIESWREISATQRITRLHLAGMTDQPEDLMTLTYMVDVARQAGLETSLMDMGAIGFNPIQKSFVDKINDPIDLFFKLYPWEWMLREKFGQELPEADCLWIEPPWKMIMANKAILPLLWEMFPGHPNLVWAGWEKPAMGGKSYVSKPVFGREGANVEITSSDGRLIASNEGPYATGPLSKRIYQEYCALPNMGGVYPILGGWVIGGEPAGLGIREDDGPITTNVSRFVPHAIHS